MINCFDYTFNKLALHTTINNSKSEQTNTQQIGMNPLYQTAFTIKANTSQSNPFVFTLPANSISQQHVQLSTSAHILKKLSLIDISKSKELIDLYKQCLLDVVQNPLIDLKSHHTIKQIVYFLQYWQLSLGKIASWPHTRTCFYSLEEKLKKYKQFDSLDYVRLKRAQLQPNKKQFLNQILAQPIHTQSLQDYIDYLKLSYQDQSENGFGFNSNPLLLKSHQFISMAGSQKNIDQRVQKGQNSQSKLKVTTNILYSDSAEDWKEISVVIQEIKKLLKYHNNQLATSLKVDLNAVLETYVYEKLPVYLNQMRSKKYSKEKIKEQIGLRRSVVVSSGAKELSQILNLTISKITSCNNFQ